MVDESYADRHRGCRRLGGDDRDNGLAELGAVGDAVNAPVVQRDHREVDREREQEDGQHQRVEEAVGGVDARGVRDHPEEGPAGEREPDVGREVDQEVLGRISPAQPPDHDRDRPDRGRGRSAEEHHRQHESQEAAGDLDLGPGLDGAKVAHRREHEQGDEQGEVPIVDGGVPDRSRDRTGQQAELGGN